MGAIHTRIFDGTDEDPKAKMRRYVIMLVALAVIVVGGGFWAYFSFLHVPEEKAAERFFHDLEAGDSQQAYRLWHADAGHYSYKDFLDDWGPTGLYGPIKSFRLEGATSPPHGGSGVVVTAEVSPYTPFPEDSDFQKTRYTKEVRLWVETHDKSLSFPPF
jgi:hypothetical protein